MGGPPLNCGRPVSFSPIAVAHCWYTVVMAAIITSNPNVMHGTPCFAGTRVAVQTLFDHLEAGYTVGKFLEQFPTVGRDQVLALLEELKRKAEESAAVVAG